MPSVFSFRSVFARLIPSSAPVVSSPNRDQVCSHCRLPHFWLDDERSVYDQLGPLYTLINFSGEPVAAPFIEAFDAAGIPLQTIDLTDRPLHYTHNYVLARTDQHIAWRGNVLPETPDRLVALLRGESA